MTSGNGARPGAIYVRISADAEGKEGAGLGVQRQEKDCRELADRLVWPIAAGAGHPKPNGVYIDNDISAMGTKRRPGYEKLLEDIKAGRVGGVLAWHTDRLHRSPIELEGYIDACEPRLVATQTVKAGELDLTTSTGRMVARILGAVARQEVEHMIERMKAKKKQMRDAGDWTGGRRPFGFVLADLIGADGEPVRNRNGIRQTLAVNETEAAEFRAACGKLLAGVSVRAITRDLNDRGVPTATGSPRGWTANGVRQTLLRASSAGLVSHGARGAHPGDITGKGNWPAIISEDTYMAVRALLTDPARTTGGQRPGNRALTLLSGIAGCGKCGSHRMRVTKNSATPAKRGYSCYDCFGVFRDVERTDEWVTSRILSMLSKPGFAAAFSPPVDVAALHARRTGLRARLDELGTLFGSGEIDGQQMAAASKPLMAQLTAVEEEVGDAYRGTGLEGIAGAPDPAAEWPGLELEVKRGIIKALVKVTILPIRYGNVPGASMGIRRGEQPRGTWFYPESVRVEPRLP